MKFTVLFLIALATLSACHVMMSDEGTQEISDFYDGLFSYFNLSSPSQIISCFDDKSAKIYIGALYEKFEVLKDTTERSSLKLHLDYGKLLLIFQALKSTFSCFALTQDFTDLLDTLNVTERNPEIFKTIAYLNYQAHYDDLYEAYKPLIDNLNSKNFTEAGSVYGSIMSYAVKTVKEEGLGRLAYNAFGNGENVRLDIDEPSDSLDCYDNNSSALYMHFLYRLAVTVTESKISDSYENALDYLENEGRDIMRQFPDGVMDCERASDDYQKKITKLGVAIYTHEFLELMRAYASRHHFAIYADLKGLRSSIENHNFVHAGSIYGHFLSAVASTK